jgi:hypothetical protein
MVNINQIERGVARYVDAEIMPKLNNVEAITRVFAGAIIGIVVKGLGGILESYTSNPALAMLGIVDDSKNIDIDLMIPEIKKNIPSEGIRWDIIHPVKKVLIVSLTFHEDDIDRLHQYIVQS